MEKAELQALVDRGLSYQEIADYFGFASRGPVTYWMRKHSLSTSSNSAKVDRSKYTEAVLSEAVRSSKTLAGVLRVLGLSYDGGNYKYIKHRITMFGIDTSHFSLKRGRASNMKTADEILVLLPPDSFRPSTVQLKRAMSERGVVEECSECGLGPVWRGLRLTLEIDHLDGNWHNNFFDNLRFLCPNCHSQQETNKRRWRNRTSAATS